MAKAAFGVDVSAVTSTLEGIQQALPPQFAASGLYPYSKDYATACPEVDADAVHTTLDMDCYAGAGSQTRRAWRTWQQRQTAVEAKLVTMKRKNLTEWRA